MASVTYDLSLYYIGRWNRDRATYVFGVYGLKKVGVHFERPKENGFDTARCQLPSYKLIIRDGFTDEEIKLFDQLVRGNAHLFYIYGGKKGDF